jgi:hypothetical protein
VPCVLLAAGTATPHAREPNRTQPPATSPSAWPGMCSALTDQAKESGTRSGDAWLIPGTLDPEHGGNILNRGYLIPYSCPSVPPSCRPYLGGDAVHVCYMLTAVPPSFHLGARSVSHSIIECRGHAARSGTRLSGETSFADQRCTIYNSADTIGGRQSRARRPDPARAAA